MSVCLFLFGFEIDRKRLRLVTQFVTVISVADRCAELRWRLQTYTSLYLQFCFIYGTRYWSSDDVMVFYYTTRSLLNKHWHFGEISGNKTAVNSNLNTMAIRRRLLQYVLLPSKNKAHYNILGCRNTVTSINWYADVGRGTFTTVFPGTLSNGGL